MILTQHFFIEASLSSAYLVWKTILVLIAAKSLQSRSDFDRVSSLIAGWLLIQAVQSGIILGLSAVGLLHRSYFIAVMLLFSSFLYWKTKLLQFLPWSVNKSWKNYLPLFAISITLIAMWIRCLFLFDYTWDAQTYGIPRLIIWLNYGSVFVHMPTLQLNLFVNEWNAELNALAYSLVAESYSGFGFGNLEVLTVLFVAIAWIARMLGAPLFWAFSLASVLGSTPAMIGLASTIKGDLLACTAFSLAFGWLIKIKKGDSSATTIGLFSLSLTLAIGSKISVLLPAAVLFLSALGIVGMSGLRNFRRFGIFKLLGLITGILFFSSRFWVNWVVYGNPLKRISVEQAKYSISNMLGNLNLATDRMFGVWKEMQGNGPMWSLSGSMGWSAWFIVVVALLILADSANQLIKSTPKHRFSSLWNSNGESIFNFLLSKNIGLQVKWVAGLGMAILASVLVSMTLTDAYPWTFRYFAPGIIVLLICIGTVIKSDRILNTLAGFLTISATLVVALNFVIISRPGEVLPTTNLQLLAMEMQKMSSPLQRISLFQKGPYQDASTQALKLDSENPLHILAFKDLETSFIPFLGSHAQNKIQTVAEGKELIAIAAQPGWDVIVILQKMEARDRRVSADLENLGYWIAIDNEQYLIAFPKSRVVLKPLLTMQDMHWSLWNSEPAAKLNISNGSPAVESLSSVDTGFVSQPIKINGSVLIRASFEGVITGPGPHAAHLSVHGKQPVILLPNGTYSGSQIFQGIVSDLGDHSLERWSFGLGGWAVGSGHLRLINFEVFELYIADGDHTSFGDEKKKLLTKLLTFFWGIGMLGGCALCGRYLLSICGVKSLSILGGCLVFGYGIFGMLLLLSLKYFNNPLIGALIFFGLFLALATYKIYLHVDFFGRVRGRKFDNVDDTKPEFSGDNLNFIDFLIAATLISWVVAISFTYFPFSWLTTGIQYQLPDIYDMPKHLFAMRSLYDAKSWPPPNPFISNATFAYNFLFYFPPAFLARLVGEPFSNFQSFSLIVVAISIALPMTILDIVRNITKSKVVHLACALLVTWVGGLSPIWLVNRPSIGFFLYSEHFLTSKIWVDELFESFIFVPQHTFAVLCGLVSMFLIMDINFGLNDYKRIFFSGIITSAGILSSFVLLPHLVISFSIILIFSFYLQWKRLGSKLFQTVCRPSIFLALLLPLGLIFPFVTEAVKWSGGTGAKIVLPEISFQWFYVIAAIGMVFPLAIISFLRVFCKEDAYGVNMQGNRMLIGMYFLVNVGLIGILFGGYPDAGLKSGLWIRITLVPLASVGLLIIFSRITHKWINIGVFSIISLLFFSIILVNYNTAKFFIMSAWRPVDPGTRNIIFYIRGLPEPSRIALFSPDQFLVALSGRQIDFDFTSIREDSYMPLEDRLRARILWDEFKQNDNKVWVELNRRYDYFIAPSGSTSDVLLSSRLIANTSIGGYSVYKTKNW